jgi:hypothetical protein
MASFCEDDVEDYVRTAKEWKQDVSALTKKIMKFVECHEGTDAIGAIAAVLEHIASGGRH